MKSEIRIIGGRWRGRRLAFRAQEGLRPTLDRHRETLFNWLMFQVEGARCLDLFAGSGALGLEALSRGAAHVDFIDTHPQTIASLKQHLQTLDCHQAQVHQQAAEAWLKAQQTQTSNRAYDLVFLDPPFHKALLQPCIYQLQYGGFLKPGSLIYVEAESDFQPTSLPPDWRLRKQKSAGQKIFLLLECCLTEQAE